MRGASAASLALGVIRHSKQTLAPQITVFFDSLNETLPQALRSSALKAPNKRPADNMG
jgi:hypothetical protein